MRSKNALLAAACALTLAACAADPEAPPAPPTSSAPPPAAPGTSNPGTPPPPGPKPAAKPSFPQAKSQGGPVIKSPKIRPIFFGADELKADVDAFVKKLETAGYWPDTATEYGVGAVTALPAVSFDEVPPAALTNEDVKRWLEKKLELGAAGPLGAPDGETLYAIYYPKQTTVSFAEGGGASCRDFGGYHEETVALGVKVGLAVMPRCTPPTGYRSLDLVTSVSSHEFFEWATDPFPFTDPAWSRTRDEDLSWMLVAGAELSDLCTAIDYTPLKPADLGYVVQRQWSNKLSSQGHHPCAPRKAEEPYFVAFPEQPDTVDVPFSYTETVRGRSVKVKPGTVRTIDVTLYSDTPGPEPWDVSVVSYDRYFGDGGPSKFDYELSETTGKAGDAIKLKITAAKDADFGVFVVTSRRGRAVNVWPGIVSTY